MASGHSCSRPVPRSSLREMGVPGVRVLMLEAGAGCRTTQDGGARVRVLAHETGAGAAGDTARGDRLTMAALQCCSLKRPVGPSGPPASGAEGCCCCGHNKALCCAPLCCAPAPGPG